MTSHMGTSHVHVYGHALRSELELPWQRGIALARQRDPDGAATCMQAILDAQPGFSPAMLQLSYLWLSNGRYCAALDLARRVASSPSGTLEFTLHVVRLLRRFELHEDVSRIVALSGWGHSTDAPLLAQLAGELGPIGLYQQATGLLERAEVLAPDRRPLQVLCGTMAFVAGDAPKSSRYLRAALMAAGPELPHVRWMLTLQPDPDPSTLDRDVEDLRTALSGVRPGSEGEAYLRFGLHNLLHAAGEHGAAWQELARGCGVKRALVPYERARQHRLFDMLMEMPAEVVSSEDPLAGEGNLLPRIVFIVGMHRSGTSIVERVLAGHPDVVDGGESYVFPAAMRATVDHAASGIIDEVLVERAAVADLSIAREYFRRHARWRADGRPVFTEKLPSNFLNVDFILRALPEARILHMCRDPMDTCFSNLRTYFDRAAAYSYDQADLADYYLQYRKLMAHWHGRHPGRILDVDYQAFVEDPEGQARRVMDFCGLGFEQVALDVSRRDGYSATASIGSVRQGILRNRGGAWVPYREQLQPLLAGLGVLDGEMEGSIP